ncbi:hypothetical protein J6590_089641 [Homalodisca vitripennis]|nr:hypothetical protein J6590_089641 [Homalodisca vitripennis]
MEQLIEEVRARPVIWDSTLEVYRDIGMKDKAWDEIAQVTLKDTMLTGLKATVNNVGNTSLSARGWPPCRSDSVSTTLVATVDGSTSVLFGVRVSQLNMNSDSIESEIDWSRETVMQLIDLYREQPVLWNPMDPDFKNKNLKNYAWNDISREIKASNTEVQAKVKTLLAQFQRELKKKKSGLGADEYKSKWCYFKAMLFLKDKTTARKIKEAGIATDDKEAADETVQASS